MRHHLFRQEALEYQTERLGGEVIGVRPLASALLTGFFVFIALAILAFAFWGEYTRKAHVSGYLAPSKGLIKIYAPEVGTLIEKHATEGQRMKRGDALFVLSTERSSRETPEVQAAAIVQLKHSRASLQEELAKQIDIDQIQTLSSETRIRGMEAELRQIRSEIATQTQRVQSAENMAGRYRHLLPTKVVPEVQVQQKEEELLDQQGKLQALERNRMELKREINALRLELSSNALKAKNQRAAIERNISSLKQEITEFETRRNTVITAPDDGVVTTILAERGQSANTTIPLLSILPDGAQLQAQLLVPSRAIGFIEPGQTVAVRYQAFPYQRFGSYKGRVKEISRTLINPNEVNLPVSLNEAVYRVTVALNSQTVKAYSEDVPLQSGMLLDADVWLDHRRIIDWVFDPLYSVTGRL